MNEKAPIRIGTRSSELATWQARKVAGELSRSGHKSELVFISSKGDRDRSTPLPEMGGEGVFTTAVNQALINDEIDAGVHSYKDLPTADASPLAIAAVMKRADARDSLVAPGGTGFLDDATFEAVIATGSNRRKGQWLNRYPNHEVVSLRGNVNTRLRKVQNEAWHGAIFAVAGLKRINLDKHISQYLDWMIPAPAQGAMAIMIRGDDERMREIISPLNHKETEVCTRVEREFLHVMEAGCSAPVGAYAKINNGRLHFKAVALTLDGQARYHFKETILAGEAKGLGAAAARQMLDEGADKIMKELKSE